MERNDFYIIYDWQVQAIGQNSALQVFALLYGLLQANGGAMQVQKSYIIQRTGLTERQVEYSIKKLIEKRFLTYEPSYIRGYYGTFTLSELGGQIRGTKKTPQNVPLKNKLGVQKCRNRGTKKPPLYNNNNNISSSTTKSAGAHVHTHENESAATPQEELTKLQEMVFAWITDNELRLGLLLHECNLITQPQEEGELKNIIQPYAAEFVKGEIIAGTDFDRKGRTETLKHFAAWLRKQTRQHYETTTTNRVGYTDEQERARNARNAQAVAAGLQAARNGADF